MNESTARNIRVQDRYDELMRIGRHGHYETMFQVVREEIESLRQQLTTLRELKQAWHDKFWEQSKETNQLRQQLADRDEQISDLTISSDTYFAERNSARDVWRRASKDRDELRKQLAELEKQNEELMIELCRRSTT